MEKVRIQPLEVTISRIVRETADAVTIYLTGDVPFHYRAGQFLTVDPHQFPQLRGVVSYFERVKGRKEPPRAYSMASAPHEPELAFTIKEEPFEPEHAPYPPLLSPLLVHGLQAGQKMRVVGFTGPYVLEEAIEAETKHVVHVCAGSGIVPNFSILKEALHSDRQLRQTLVYSNKTHADIIFRDAIDELQRRFPDRLRVVHTLSREPEIGHLGPSYRAGRIGQTLLAELIEDSASARVFTCGPGISTFELRAARKAGTTPTPRFLETMLLELQAIGVPKDHIHYESYG